MSYLGWYQNLEGATPTPDPPAGDEVNGLLLLVGVGRSLPPILFSWWAWEIISWMTSKIST